MKNLLRILGGLLVLILLILASGVGYLFYVGPRLDASSKAYVQQNVPPILNTWSDQALWDRAAPELKNVTSREQLKKLFEKFSGVLGELRNYDDPPSGEATLSFHINKGKVVTARYTLKATFDKGAAVVNVGLIEHDGQWHLISFHVNSPVLLQ